MSCTFPLSPVPLSMFHGDGTMAKTEKSSLFRELENRIDSSSLDSFDAVIIDGNFLLHLLPSGKTTTYCVLARLILIQSMSLSKKEVDLLFDSYYEPSIKDGERNRLGIDEQKHIITEPEQKCPWDLSVARRQWFLTWGTCTPRGYETINLGVREMLASLMLYL